MRERASPCARRAASWGPWPDAACAGPTTPSWAPPPSLRNATARSVPSGCLRRGAKDLLVLPGRKRRYRRRRCLIHWMGEASRSATLAVWSASVLRHLSARSGVRGYLPRAERPPTRAQYGMRETARCRVPRRSWRTVLEMRTELRFGGCRAQEAGAGAWRKAPAQMLIVGVHRAHTASPSAFRALLDGGQWPMLIVYRGSP